MKPDEKSDESPITFVAAETPKDSSVFLFNICKCPFCGAVFRLNRKQQENMIEFIEAGKNYYPICDDCGNIVIQMKEEGIDDGEIIGRLYSRVHESDHGYSGSV